MWYTLTFRWQGLEWSSPPKLGEVESVKAVSDIYSPVSGEIVEVNQDVIDHPEVVNEDPYGRGWLLRVPNPGRFGVR